MAKSFKEIGKKAEDLIEQGKEADQKVQSCQARVVASNSRVVAARMQLAAASETDEEGNPVGDVGYARAQLSMAENMLAASQRALTTAQGEANRVKQQKNSHVQEIERHNRVEQSNLDKLRRLRASAFGTDSIALAEGIAERYNEAEDARVALLRSMGIDTKPDYVSAGENGGSDIKWSGGGFATIDTTGQVQRYRGGSSTDTHGTGIATPIGGGLGDISGLNGSVRADIQGVEQSASDAKSFLEKLFRISKTNQPNEVALIDFNGLLLVNDNMTGDRYFVKGNNYDRFCFFWQNPEKYNSIDVKITKTINASDIEGIYLNINEAQDPRLFWNRGHDYPVDSEEYFMEVASHIPEVRACLEAGASVDSIRNNPSLKTCYDYYFDTPINVYEVDNYYYFAGAGRHRCMAAQKLGHDIPVNVIGRYEYESSDIEKIPKDLQLSAENYSRAFTMIGDEYNNTRRLVDYVNSIEKSDKRVVNLYNNIAKMDNLDQIGIKFTITHDNDHALKRRGIKLDDKVRTSEMVLVIPRLFGNNITGQVQTTLHEQMHFIDQLLKSDVGDFYSPGFAASNERMRRVLKSSSCDIGQDIKSMFNNHAKELNELGLSLRVEYDSAVSSAKKQLRIDGDFESYLNRVNDAKETLESTYDYHARNLMQGGIGQLEDIYDALSGGRFFDSGIVSFGHGAKYYRSNEARIDEMIANYASLSITRPDLVALLKKDKPEVVTALDNIIDLMNERVRSYE